MSCGPACARQILLDAGVKVTEAEIRDLSGCTDLLGTRAEDLARVLTQLHPTFQYQGGGVHPSDLDALLARAPFIAIIRAPQGKHMIIVDGVAQGTLYFRDPAGAKGDTSSYGAEGTLSRAEFEELWRGSLAVVCRR